MQCSPNRVHLAFPSYASTCWCSPCPEAHTPRPIVQADCGQDIKLSHFHILCMYINYAPQLPAQTICSNTNFILLFFPLSIFMIRFARAATRYNCDIAGQQK